MRWPCHAVGVGTTIIVSAGPTPSLEFFAGKTSRGLSRCLVRVGFPELGLSWEHYVAAPAPPDVIIDGVVCDTRADMVIRTFWVISPLHISKSSTS